jgi:hypothetical protein
VAKKKISTRWRTEARLLYAAHGNDRIAIRASLNRKYGSLVAIYVIIRIVFFLIDLWQDLNIEEPSECPSAAELDHVEFTDEDDIDS